jgi:hypothetical protein
LFANHPGMQVVAPPAPTLPALPAEAAA